MRLFCLIIILLITGCIPSTQEDSCDTIYYKEYRKNNEQDFLTSLAYTKQFSEWRKQERHADKIFTGDSITAVWGTIYNDIPGGYDWMTDTRITNVMNTGIPGNTTCDMIERYKAHVKDFEPEFVFLHVGGNDLVSNIPDNIILKNLYELFRIITYNKKVRLVYGGIPPTKVNFANDKKVELHNKIKKYLRKEIPNSCFISIDDYVAVNGVEGNRSKHEIEGDGIHFSPSVYNEYKKRVEAAFKDKQRTGVICYHQ